MNSKEHKEYLKDFEEFSKKITSSMENAEGFLQRAGILTPTGRLKKAYRL